ncbi:MAG: pyrroloquinoline quinone-dependent dehydrogenase [Bryobacterales bacterium]|nr:pyrroloquinoline quinone-dependent dehydrogenase [Bryobacterales bacterium]
MRSHLRFALLTFALLRLTFTSAYGQEGAKNGEWRTYGGDLGNTHYSPLDQINAANFNKLQIAWRFKTENLGPRPEFNLEGTPLMVHGVLYATVGSRRDVAALDAATGELLWVHGENEGARAGASPRQLSGRGLAYWTDGRQERILYVTIGYRLVALDAKTGDRIPGFGEDGIVDLKLNDDQEMDLVTGEVGLHAAPVVADDVVIVGAAHKPGATPKSMRNVRGYVRGFDVRTGKRLWIFHTIPRSNEFGYDTWEKDSASYTGNTGVWGQISVDEELGTAYIPVELPTGDFYGGHRPGNNLFGETILAVDLKTGQRKWHYQLVHHGIWDMDIPCAPMLVNITINGQSVKALAQPTKQAFSYVFDRVTGKPIWPIVEKPVEQSSVPGEKTSPTQPFPTKPPAYDAQGFTLDDVIDFTPKLKAEAEKIVTQYHLGPVFTPAVVSTPGGPYGTLAMGTAGGGTNWPGGSYDPETHIIYLPSQREVWNVSLVPGDPKRTDMAYMAGSVSHNRDTSEFGIGFTVEGLPVEKPPYGSITAINLDKGDILWQIAHGETPDSIRNNLALKGLNIPRTGRPGNFGILVTKTLLIAGEHSVARQPDARLRAYDKATGKDIGAVPMPAGQTGTPMTYMLNGSQYIVVAVGSVGFPAELVAYKLPVE